MHGADDRPRGPGDRWGAPAGRRIERRPTGDRTGLDATARTLLGTLAGRALDARGRRLLGDDAAVAVLESLDPAMRAFALRGLGVDADLALSIAVRARLIDDRVRAYLATAPDAVVLHAGCGLDTRYERLAPPGGVTWFELDEQPVMDLRRVVLGEPTPTHRAIAGSVTDIGALDAIPVGRPTLLVAEGLTMYLTAETGGAFLARVADRFGAHGGGVGGEMLFDVASRLGIGLQGLNAVVRHAGARLTWGIDEPRSLEALGLSLLEDVPADEMLREAGPYLGTTRLRLHAAVARLGPIRRMGRLLRYGF